MKIRFSPEAKSAIELIEAYYAERSPSACHNVITDIFDVFDLLSNNPEAGRLHSSKSFRLMVSGKYRFVVTYVTHSDYVEIIDIYRHQNRDYS
jgi:plasmid stabilization system protein ParE